MPISSRFVIRSTIILLAIAFLTLLGIVASTAWLRKKSIAYYEESNRSRALRVAEVDLRNALQGAESSQRGFLVSGNEIYLAPYGTAKAVAQRRSQDVLTELKSSNAPAAAHLEKVIEDKIAEMDRSIALKKDRNDAEALSSFNKNVGKALMDEANVF